MPAEPVAHEVDGCRGGRARAEQLADAEFFQRSDVFFRSPSQCCSTSLATTRGTSDGGR